MDEDVHLRKELAIRNHIDHNHLAESQSISDELLKEDPDNPYALLSSALTTPYLSKRIIDLNNALKNSREGPFVNEVRRLLEDYTVIFVENHRKTESWEYFFIDGECMNYGRFLMCNIRKGRHLINISRIGTYVDIQDRGTLIFKNGEIIFKKEVPESPTGFTPVYLRPVKVWIKGEVKETMDSILVNEYRYPFLRAADGRRYIEIPRGTSIFEQDSDYFDQNCKKIYTLIEDSDMVFRKITKDVTVKTRLHLVKVRKPMECWEYTIESVHRT